MIITTGNDIAGHQITQYLGIVRDIVVRATEIACCFVGGLRSIGRGYIPAYAVVFEEARQHAYELIVRRASTEGADAVIAFRYDATEFSQRSTEVLAYGTAVKVQKL